MHFQLFQMSVEPSSPRWPMSRPVTRSLGRDLNREQEIVEHEVSQRRQSFGMSTPPRSGSAERLFLANPLYRSVGDDNPSTYEGHVANDNGSPDNEIQFGNIHQNTAEGPGPEAISSNSRSAMGTASSTTGRAPAEDDVKAYLRQELESFKRAQEGVQQARTMEQEALLRSMKELMHKLNNSQANYNQQAVTMDTANRYGLSNRPSNPVASAPSAYGKSSSDLMSLWLPLWEDNGLGRGLPRAPSGSVSSSFSRNEPKYHVSVYNGDNGFRAFWLQLKSVAVSCGWSSHEVLHRLVSSLRDKALEYFFDLPVHIQGDLNAAVVAMSRRFDDHTLPETYRQKLSTLKQQTKESVENFSSRVRQMVSKAFPEFVGSDTAEAMIIEHVISGLKNQTVAYDVMSKKPKTVVECLDMVQWHESILQRQKSARIQAVSVANEHLSISGDDTMEASVARVSSTANVSEERLFQFGRELKEAICRQLGTKEQDNKDKSKQWKSKVECYYCKELGHMKRECPKFKADGCPQPSHKNKSETLN